MYILISLGFSWMNLLGHKVCGMLWQRLLVGHLSKFLFFFASWVVPGISFPSLTCSWVWLSSSQWNRRVCLFYAICGLRLLTSRCTSSRSSSPRLPVNGRGRGLKDRRKLCPLATTWRELSFHWTRNIYLRG